MRNLRGSLPDWCYFPGLIRSFYSGRTHRASHEVRCFHFLPGRDLDDMTSFFIVLQQVGLFAVYMTIGVISVKSGVLNKDGLGVLSLFVTRVA